VKRLKLWTSATETAWRKRKLDHMREAPLIHQPGDFDLAAAHHVRTRQSM